MNLLAFILVAPAVGAGVAARAEVSLRTHKNPIRKVVVMLQDMQKSVEEERDRNVELFDKFMCYCKTQGESLAAAISNGESKIDELLSLVTEKGATNSQLKQEIEGHVGDRQQAEQQRKENAALREKEQADFAEGAGEMKSNIESLTSALKSLKTTGVSASMLQTSALGEKLRGAVSSNSAVAPEDRSAFLALLSTGQGEGEGGDGSNDQIIGVINQILDETKAALADATGAEAQRKANSDALEDAKDKEIKAATIAIEQKMDRAAQAAMRKVGAQGELAGFEKALATDQEMQVNMGKACADKSREQELTAQARTAELSALSEAVEILNSDNALDTFKKSIPSAAASFLQTSSHTALKSLLRTRSSIRARGQSRQRAAHRRGRARAVSSKGFEKVVGMVDGMVDILKEAEENDEAKREHCLLSMKDAEAKKQELETVVKGLMSSIEEKNDEVADMVAAVATSQAGISALDKSVAEATEQRKEEHAAFVASMASNNAASDLLKMAVNRLNKFYNPANYVAPTEEPELLQEGDGQGGIFFAQVRARQPQPGFLQQPKQASAGIFALLAQIDKEVAVAMTEEKKDEEDSQKDYEESMNEAATKRKDDSQLIITAEVAKSEADATLDDLKAEKSQKATMLKFTNEKISYLHRFCDQFLAAYDARQKARGAEIESDKIGKQLLANADTNETSIA